MNKRTLLNLALLMLLAGLGLIAWFQPGHTPPAPAATLKLFDAQKITAIELLRAGKDTIALEKTGDQWRMTAPLQVIADKYLIDSLIGMTTAVSYAQFDASGVDLGHFMLDAPRVTVRFDDLNVQFGDTEPLSGRRYIMAGNTVYLIDDNVYRRVTGEPVSLMSRLLLPAGGRIEAIALPGRRISLGEEGAWTITPPAGNISQDDVVALLDEWRNAQAIRVNLAGADAAGDVVEVQLAGQSSPWRFALLQRENEWLLVRHDLGVAYQLTENQFQRLTTLARPAASDQ